MRVRDFGLGVFVGVACGWAVGVWSASGDRAEHAPAPEPPPRRIEPPRASERDEPRRRAEPQAGVDPQLAPAPPKPDVERKEVIRTGDANALRRVDVRSKPLNDEEAGVVAGRLSEAQAAGDRELYIRLLEVLGASASPAARAKFVEHFGNLSIPMQSLKTNIYGDFHRWFDEADAVPGLAAAARARFDAEGTDPDRFNYRGLIRMIGRHGGAHDIRWLETLSADPRYDDEALGAIARGRDPEVDAAIERLTTARGANPEWLNEYVRNRPGQAAALLTRLVQQADAGGNAYDASGVFRLLGRATAATKDIAPVRDVLLALRKPSLRVAAVYAVQELHAARLEVAGLQPILDEPLRLLESDEWMTTRGCDCRYAIEHNRLLWTERSAASLELAAARHEGSDWSAQFLRVAKLIRDSLADPWRAK